MTVLFSPGTRWQVPRGADAPDHLILDLETFSTVDLKKVGPHYYAAHPTTDVSVACYAFGQDEDVRVWRPGQPVPDEIRDHLATGGRIIAHNAAFERAILQNILAPRYGWPIPAPDQWCCTLSRAAYCGLPTSLEDLSGAMALTHKKDTEGRGVMLRCARPRGFRPDGSPRWWHEEEPDRLVALTEYCKQDVRAEQELDHRLPDLPARERRLWLMDAVINGRGIAIDVVGADVLARATVAELARLDAEMLRITDGAVARTTALPALKGWLQGRGIDLLSLDKEHMAHALVRNDVKADPAVLRALQLRREGSLASTAKLKPMLGTLGPDNRARGLFQYYGAGRTGRWAGRRIQPQNLVHGLKDAGATIDAMTAGADLCALAAERDSAPLALVAGCLRGLFIAPVGRRLVATDLAQIEARVLAWLAGQEDVLEVFRTGEDIYLYTAQRQGSDDRAFGKVLVLALGFGMGAERFMSTAKTYGVILDLAQAAQCVAAWRAANPKIVRLWHDVEDAVTYVVRGKVGGELAIGHCLIRRKPHSIRIRLPAGRELIYHDMGVVPRVDGTPGTDLAFMGVHPLSKKWTQQRTYGARLVENITQATARDVLANAMLTLHERGRCLVGSVHDEVLLEAGAAEADALLNETLELMRTPPAWAEGLPVDASGFVSPRYRKS